MKKSSTRSLAYSQPCTRRSCCGSEAYLLHLLSISGPPGFVLFRDAWYNEFVLSGIWGAQRNPFSADSDKLDRHGIWTCSHCRDGHECSIRLPLLRKPHSTTEG